MLLANGNLVSREVVEEQNRVSETGNQIVWQKVKFQISIPFGEGEYLMTFYTSGTRVKYLYEIPLNKRVKIVFVPKTWNDPQFGDITENYARRIELYNPEYDREQRRKREDIPTNYERRERKEKY